jgi:DNA replication protein DnaC
MEHIHHISENISSGRRRDWGTSPAQEVLSQERVPIPLVTRRHFPCNRECDAIKDQCFPGTARISPPAQVTRPGDQCPLCKGAGYRRMDVPYGHPQFGKALPCRCKLNERTVIRREELLRISNLGVLSEKSFETFRLRVPGVQQGYQAALAFATHPKGWLLLLGPYGCGKTHLAAAIANVCLARSSVVLFSTVPDLLDHLRSTFAPMSEVVYDELFSLMREAELLVLDDLGTQNPTPWANEKLFQLLNHRYQQRLPTVITANDQSLLILDERIRSRLDDRELVRKEVFERAKDYRPFNHTEQTQSNSHPEEKRQ